MSVFPPEIHQWLLERGLTDDVIKTFHLSWDSEKKRIVIPIYDRNGTILFHKYRKSPFDKNEDTPKYTYDKGGSVQLLGQDSLAFMPIVIICEGEFDAMVLHEQGFFGVSSTGGSSSFQEAWGDLFSDKETYIVYDHDLAGIKGAFNVQSIIPHAKMIWLPPSVGDHGDITDYFIKLHKNHEDFVKLMEQAKTYHVPRPVKDLPKTKKALNDLIKQEGAYMNELLVESRSNPAIKILIDYFQQRRNEFKKALKFNYRRQRNSREDVQFDDKKTRAKAVPIDTLLTFRGGFTRCIWHDEKTPSLHYYAKDNKVKCFGGCEKSRDAIDVMMQLKGCSMNEAIDYLLNTK